MERVTNKLNRQKYSVAEHLILLGIRNETQTHTIHKMEVTPNYSYVFDFENEFIHQDTRIWMIKNWTWVFYYCGVYMLIIFGGQYWMQNRPRWVFIWIYLEYRIESFMGGFISLNFHYQFNLPYQIVRCSLRLNTIRLKCIDKRKRFEWKSKTECNERNETKWVIRWIDNIRNEKFMNVIKS